MELCEGDSEGEKDVADGAKAIDPLLQLITLFSRSALTERRCVRITVDFNYWSNLLPGKVNV